MHEQCVIDDTLKRTYERLVGDTDTNAKESLKPPTKKGRRKSAKSTAPTHVWDGIFSATIIPREAEHGNSTTDNGHENDNDTAPDSANENETDIMTAGKILVTDLRTPSATDGDEHNAWEVDIVCLGCRRKVK